MKPCEKCWGTGVEQDQQALGLAAWRARAERCESMAAAAQRMGISFSYLSLLEAGKRKWTKELYQKATRKP